MFTVNNADSLSFKSAVGSIGLNYLKAKGVDGQVHCCPQPHCLVCWVHCSSHACGSHCPWFHWYTEVPYLMISKSFQNALSALTAGCLLMRLSLFTVQCLLYLSSDCSDQHNDFVLPTQWFLHNKCFCTVYSYC